MFVLRFFKNLIIQNRFKSILVPICILMFYFHLTLPHSVTNKKTFYTKFSLPEDTTHTVYLIPDNTESEFSTKKLKNSEHTVIGNGITYTNSNPAFWGSAILGFLCLILLLGMTIWGDEDHNWEVRKCLTKSYIKSIGFELENSIYYYHLRGKLIYKGSQKPSFGDLKKGIENFIDHSNLLEKFEGTTQKKRNSKLDKILK
jgi:hypothetical protein